MVDIEYPTFTSKIGIDPLLCRVDNDADNIFNLEVNGNLCDKQPGQSDSCKGDNVFIKQSMINRISNKYGDTTFINNNKNKLIAMMKHPNYSKSLCHNTLNKASYVDKMTYSQAVLPYNYEYCDKDSPCNNYKNTIYEKTNTIPHNMVNYGSKDDNNTSLSSDIFDNQTNNNIVNNNNELCNNFYKVYCEKLNSMLKEKFGDKFDTSMLGEYENMCLCYQDLYKDYLPKRIYKGFSAPKNGDIAADVANNQLQQILNNGGLMISDKCYNTHTKNDNQSIKIRYAPSTDWNQINQANIVICNNMIDMNDTNIEANEQGKILFNQKSACSAGDSTVPDNTHTTPNNTPSTDNKTNDNSNITNNNQTNNNQTNNNQPNNNQTNINDNTETKNNEQLLNESDNKVSNSNNSNINVPNDSNINDLNNSNINYPNINDSNTNLESTNNIMDKIKENKTYVGIGGGVSLCCCCICCICIIMILSKSN